MATVRDLIKDALLDLGVLAAGEEPAASDEAACFDVFEHMVQELPGLGVGGSLKPVVVTVSPYTAKEDERIVWTGVGALTVVLPATFDEGRRPPRDGARVFVTGADPEAWVYVASKAEWVDLFAFTVNTVDPLGRDCNKALASVLAAEIAPRFGVQLTQPIAEGAERGRRTLAARFPADMTGVIDPALWSYWSTWPGARA